MTELVEKTIEHTVFKTCYLSTGKGNPVLFIHGSGPGVSARANWLGTLSSPLAEHFHMIAPDVVGFGQTKMPDHFELTHDARVEHLIQFMDAMGIETFDVVGNSMGGALALALAYRYPTRIRKMVLMGSVGISFELTTALDYVWGYEPSTQAMEQVIRYMAWDQNRINDDLVKLRYEASMVPGVQEHYSAAFAAPRQRHIDAMALTEEQLSEITTETLLIHGAHDKVIPLDETSLKMAKILPNADLIVFGKCGHWTQIERAEDFQYHIKRFLGTT